MSSRPFESSNTSKFIIFQEEHKGPKNEILISGAPKSLVPGFHATCVMCLSSLLSVLVLYRLNGADANTMV